MSLIKKWEMFYTDSKKDTELVDQISIDTRNKRYILDINEDSIITDGYYEDDTPIESFYVSRYIFDIIVSGVKANGFIKYIEEDTKE